MTPREARQALLSAFADADVRTMDDLGGLVSPPVVLIGPPTLLRTTPGIEPNEATFSIFAVVDADERALDRLDELEPQVVEVIETATFAGAPMGAVVRSSTPQFYVSGNANLPCYRMQTEVPL